MCTLGMVLLRRTLTEIVKELNGSSIILGDFNLHHPVWGARRSSRNSDVFVEWLTFSSYCIINTTSMTHIAPGGTSSLIDLSLCSADILPKITYTVEDDLWGSDHFRMQLTMSLTSPGPRPRLQHRWSSIIEDVNQALSPVDSTDYGSFLSILQTAMNNHKSRSNCSHKGFPSWWTARCSNLRHQKRFYLQRTQRGASMRDWVLYKRFADKLRSTIKEEKRKFWDTACEEAGDLRLLQRIFRKLRTRPQDSPDSHLCILGSDGPIFDADAQADLFVDAYSGGAHTEPLATDYGNSNPDLNHDESNYPGRR